MSYEMNSAPMGVEEWAAFEELFEAASAFKGKRGAFMALGTQDDRTQRLWAALAFAESALAQKAAANERPVGWWNGILPDVTDRSPYDPSIRWGADAENSGHDIPLYAGVNPSRVQQPAAVDEGARLDAERMDAIKRLRLAVTPVEGGGWDVSVFGAEDCKETLLGSGADVRSAIDEAVTLAAQQGGHR